MRCKDEQEILTLISCGNPDGLKSLFDLYYKPLCIFAMNFLDSFGESEDIVQDLFVKFWEKYKDKQFEGSLRAYFFTAVRHNCAKVLKLKNRYNWKRNISTSRCIPKRSLRESAGNYMPK